MKRAPQLPRRFGRDGSPFDLGRLTVRQQYIASQSILRYERPHCPGTTLTVDLRGILVDGTGSMVPTFTAENP